MAPPPDEIPDIDAVVDRLRSTAEVRRKEGLYPAGLEEDLDAHFRRIAAHRVEPDLSRLDELVERVRALPGLSTERISPASDLPGGASLHRAVARLTDRQVQGVLEQVQDVVSALQAVVGELADALRRPNTHLHPDLLGQVDALQERLTALERHPVDAPGGLAEIGRRLERLEVAEARRQFRPPFRWEAFDAEFRGSTDEIKERAADLVPLLAGAGPVLDIGCGRGEFLELLRDAGTAGRGVDIDPQLVRDAVERGLDVEVGDGLEVVGGQTYRSVGAPDFAVRPLLWFFPSPPDGSLGALVLIQVVEHLLPQQLVDLVTLAVDKVRPSGKVVIETPNPQSLYIFARAFYLDPTHQAPVHPLYLRFLFEQAGFSSAELRWRSPPPAPEVLVPVGDEHHDANVERVNQVLFAPQDYALIATR
jgi:SAM-dependent methyltransferase